MTDISFYKSVSQTKSTKTIPLDLFLENIQNGEWQDIVLPVRVITDDDARKKAKEKAPCVTISGKFKERRDNGIEVHSGFIAIDIDDVEDVNHLKSLVCTDPHVYAAFQSISGRGLCLLFKINPTKHRESFEGISEYLFSNFQIIVDPTSINVSRLRFVSYDPYIFTNTAATKFTKYPKSKPPKKIEKAIFAKDDFEQILEQIQSRRLNLCENYHEWLRIAFAFVHHFGEAGRNYFHIVSQYSSKYDSFITDKQYMACLKHKGSTQATIATFYYYCKNAGVQVYSERTRKIAYSAHHGKKGGLSANAIAENLKKFEDIDGPDVAPMVQKVIDDGIELNEDTLIDQVELWLRQNYQLRRNEITRYIENNGKPMKQTDYNSIFIKAKKVFDNLNFELMDRLINSDFVPDFNPFIDFIENHKDITTTGHIEALFGSIQSNDNDYLLHFGKKWLVSVVASIYGQHSPLMLILSGEVQGSGKTEFFRRLLPKELKDYYAESKLDAGKDDEILMTQKIIIMDDEMGGKSKRESKRLKELTSKQTFSLREPYGRNNVDLNRLAVLCGTTNDNEVLNDPTGNRRLIPIEVLSINHSQYNTVDKVALFMEAHRLYKDGFAYNLSRHDIEYLGKYGDKFEETSMEAELILKYFEPGGSMKLSSTEIKVELEDRSRQRLSIDKIGKMLKKFGFVQSRGERVNGRNIRRWNVNKIEFLADLPDEGKWSPVVSKLPF